MGVLASGNKDMNKIGCLDYETSGLNYWENDFRVVSASFAFNGSATKFLQGEAEVGTLLRSLILQGYKFVVHNASFEFGVTYAVYRIKLPIEADTMRLAQNYGPPMIKVGAGKSVPRFGLVHCVKKYLGIDNFKKPFHDLLHSMGYKDAGPNLQHLPPDELMRYNNLDAELTLRIYNFITDYFLSIKHNWKADHKLFLAGVEGLSHAKHRGVKIDRDLLIGNIANAGKILDNIDESFIARYGEYCDEIEEENIRKKWKTEKRRQKARDTNELPFNTGSGDQLGRLFRDKLGIAVTFYTASGKPSTKAAHLGSYGEAGLLLSDRGSLSVKIGHMKSLYKVSEKDGRWHPSYQLVRTATGRLAGGEGEGVKVSVKLNPQGLARRFKPLMECIVADEGMSFVSIDLSAGEPSILAHYSKDPNYYAATVGMVGKKPYIDDQGILQISDIYFMGASVSPTGEKIIQEQFKSGAFDNWVEDEASVKGTQPLKGLRSDSKGQILGMGYEMGPEKMVEQAYDAGRVIKLADAKTFHHNYWFKLFPKIQQTKEILARRFKSQKYLVNRFGFLLRPDSPHKCLNYFIQSSVSGLMYALWILIVKNTPDDLLLLLEGIVHDEFVIQIPTKDLARMEKIVNESVNELNTWLNWIVPIRTGWVVGKNFYEAK